MQSRRSMPAFNRSEYDEARLSKRMHFLSSAWQDQGSVRSQQGKRDRIKALLKQRECNNAQLSTAMHLLAEGQASGETAACSLGTLDEVRSGYLQCDDGRLSKRMHSC